MGCEPRSVSASAERASTTSSSRRRSASASGRTTPTPTRTRLPTLAEPASRHTAPSPGPDHPASVGSSRSAPCSASPPARSGVPATSGRPSTSPGFVERLPKPLDEADRLTLTEARGGDSPGDRRDRALILFLLSTGCRISKALGLDRQDWGHDCIVVRGKGDRERSVLVTDNARHAVDEYLAARGASSPALFVGLQPATDNRLTPQGAAFICRRLAGRLGIPPFHPHRLRHTLGTLLQDRIGDARLTAETLGHAGLASVAGYTKISEARRRQALEVVEEAGL
jgi:integrase